MPHQPLKRPRRPNALSARSLVILFLATLSVSFMLLLILFQVVFKNIHLQFNTRTPETAPTLSSQTGSFFQGESPMFQRMGVQSANVQTPGRSGRSNTVISPALDASSIESSSTAASNPSLSNNESAANADSATPLPSLPSLTSKPPSATSKSAPLPSGNKPPSPKLPAATPPVTAEPFELE